MEDLKIKYMVYWIKKMMSTTFILWIYIWNNQVKYIKKTYHYVNWIFFDQRLQIEDKHLVMQTKQEAVPISEIKVLVPNMPRSRLGHMLD